MDVSDIKHDDLQQTPAVSAFARVGLLAYLFLIVYASWYPFSGWREIGIGAWDFLLAPMPRYWTSFDVVTNVIGYFPFGMLLVFALYPQLRRSGAVAVAIFCAILLSAVIEAGQTFLPSRVASNLDLMTNALGGVLGAIAGAMLTPTFLEQSRLLRLRQQWFAHDAGSGLIVMGLWPLAQIYPQPYLFGHAQLLPILSAWLSEWLEVPVDLGGVMRRGAMLAAEQYWLAETVITACGLTGATLTVVCLLRKQAPKARLIAAAIAIALTVKSLASALFFSPENAFAWLTPGAQGGLLVGGMMVSGLAFARPAILRRLAAVSLLVSVCAVNVVPANPYFIATLQAWLQGKFLNFNGAAHFLSLFWPLFALWFLLHPMHKPRYSQRGDEQR